MNTRELFENYYDNKCKVVFLENMIKQRKIDLLPSMTPHLSHTPKAKSNTSSVERTVLSWEDDEEINRLLKDKAKTENDIKTVETVIEIASPKIQELLNLRYIEQETLEFIAEKLFLSVSTVERQLSKYFKQMDAVLGVMSTETGTMHA